MSTISDLNSSFIIELLFEEEVKRPTAGAVLRAAKETFGDIEAITRNNDITSFAVQNYTAYKKEAPGSFEYPALRLSDFIYSVFSTCSLQLTISRRNASHSLLLCGRLPRAEDP